MVEYTKLSPLPVPERFPILNEVLFHVKNILRPLYIPDMKEDRLTYVRHFSLRFFEKNWILPNFPIQKVAS